MTDTPKAAGKPAVEIVSTTVATIGPIDSPVPAAQRRRRGERIRMLGVTAVSWTRRTLVWTAEPTPLSEAELLRERRLPALAIGGLAAPPIAALVILMAGPATDWTSLFGVFLAGLAALLFIRATVPYFIRLFRARRRRTADRHTVVEEPTEGTL